MLFLSPVLVPGTQRLYRQVKVKKGIVDSNRFVFQAADKKQLTLSQVCCTVYSEKYIVDLKV